MHPLDGARERLKRADENIRNLDVEIGTFLKPVPVISFEGENPVFTDDDKKAWEELRNFIVNNTVKPRFAVLAGEIVHHLRSAFDHLAWQLSSSELQTNSPHQIEFPIFRQEPDWCAGLTKNKICRYCRKIEGIASPSALTRIEALQPYKRSDWDRHPLWLIHDMDRTDKHRELILAVYIMKLNVTGNAQFTAVGQQMPWELKPRNLRILGVSEVQVKGQMSAQITFKEFSGRDDQPIIPTLQNLLSFTVNSVESFASEFV